MEKGQNIKHITPLATREGQGESPFEFTADEMFKVRNLTDALIKTVGDTLLPDDEEKVRARLRYAFDNNQIQRDIFGLNPILMALQTAQIAVDEIGLRRDGVLAILLYTEVINGFSTVEELRKDFGDGVATIVHGLVRLHELYKKTPVIETENFRNLLLSFAEDMRVILIMIADRVNIMREIRDTEAGEARQRVSEEASYLYAPLAHKLGLYKLKSELEDLSLKYLEHDAYYHIKDKLSATKTARDKYIDDFIGPVKAKLDAAGLKFHIKGRTKSIHSIWQKMKKQKCPFEGVYDLFAIRIILLPPDEESSLSPEGERAGERGWEKMQCWQVYSIVTDMYQPNPKRLRDWLSVPKSNGYESLHITVLGPPAQQGSLPLGGGRGERPWVEVQIRTERMDEIAERGLAAHWRYKGIKGESGLDEWLTSIRQALEAGDNLQVIDQFKLDLYEDEVYVFSPKGDILKFPSGAVVLDYAYHIHSKIGNTCIGAKINGKNVSMRETLHSGDTVEIITSTTQKPKQEWINIVKTSRAKAKIRNALKETQVKDGLFAKELIERRLNNRKIKLEESTMSHTIRKLGYKVITEFYKDVADGKLDVNEVIDLYADIQEFGPNYDRQPQQQLSAEEFQYQNPETKKAANSEDVLVIDRNLKGLDYTLAKCCNPIYGDDVFGFVTVSGGIKIHRCDCPNAGELRRRFGYRIVKARWDGKGKGQYDITIQVIGNDDIGIVSNISNLISKEEKIAIRSINIDSNDGLFRGTITILIDDTQKLEGLMKKLRLVRGVKGVARL